MTGFEHIDDQVPDIVERAAAVPPALEAVGSPLLRRIYAGRGIQTPEELDYPLAGLPGFSLFKGMEAAVDALEQAINEQRPIRIVGDFDADGATSTALALEVLEFFDARVDFFMPQRDTHGYGLSPAIVDALGAPADGNGLVMTVDNGISSTVGVEAAHEVGWDVVITDHHLPGKQLPNARAIVNPNQPGCCFPSKNLAGVGVVFYVMAGLRARMGHKGWASLPHLANMLDLVAIGTVADVVRLDHVNRTLVSQGIRRIRAGRSRAGIAALAEVAGRDPGQLDTDDIGFAIGPRINAAGRLENMRFGVSCLRAESAFRARQAAEVLSSINHERRSTQQQMQAEAEEALARLTLQADLPSALVVHEPSWHEGIVGLVASRVREQVHRPVVAFARSGEVGMLKGSARSIPGLHIRDALATVEADNSGLIKHFGGHAQAAGLTLEASRLQFFSDQLAAVVDRRLTPAMKLRQYVTDGELQAGDHSLSVARELREAGPWGAGFEAPLFHGRYQILDQRIVGRGHLKLTVQPDQASGQSVEAMWFNRDELLDTAQPYRLVFQLRVNEFRGRVSANMIIEHGRIDDMN